MVKLKKRVWTVAVKTVLFIAFTPSLLSAQNVTLVGTIKNGTTGENGRVEHLSLMGFDTGMNILDERENVSANFVFQDVPPAPQRPYVVMAQFKGVQYSTSVTVPAGRDTVAVQLTVYEPTAVPADISVKDAQYQFVASENLLNIRKTYFVSNNSHPPATYVNENQTFSFRVPPESHGIEFVTVNRGLIPLNQDPIPTGAPDIFAVNYPIIPGMTKVDLSYHVEYTNHAYTYSEKILYNIENLFVVASPANMVVSGDSLAPSGADAARDFKVFKREHLSAGETVSLFLSGGTPNPLANTASGQPTSTSVMSLGEILFSIVMIFSLLMVGMLISRNKTPVRDAPSHGIPNKLLKRKKEMLDKIAELDDKFAQHRLKESDYHRQRTYLKNELIEIYKKIEHKT